eukprot:116695-Pleurochrysis_carterae.AAC.3
MSDSPRVGDGGEGDVDQLAAHREARAAHDGLHCHRGAVEVVLLERGARHLEPARRAVEQLLNGGPHGARSRQRVGARGHDGLCACSAGG